MGCGVVNRPLSRHELASSLIAWIKMHLPEDMGRSLDVRDVHGPVESIAILTIDLTEDVTVRIVCVDPEASTLYPHHQYFCPLLGGIFRKITCRFMACCASRNPPSGAYTVPGNSGPRKYETGPER